MNIYDFLAEYWFYIAGSVVVLWLFFPAIMGGLVWLRNRKSGGNTTDVIDPRPPHIANLTSLVMYFGSYKDQPTKERAMRNIAELKNDVLPGPEYVPPQPGAPA